jgi:multiple sugar transport system permease protein
MEAISEAKTKQGLLFTLGRHLNRESVFKLSLVAPLQLLLWFLLIIPFIIVIYLSFVKWQPVFGSWTEAPWVWFENFQKLFTEIRFLEALGRTLAIVVIAVTLEFIFALGLALLFTRNFFGKRLFTSVILYPMMLPWVVVGFIFYLLFLDHGLVNSILTTIFGATATISWLRHSVTAMSAIILGDVWQWTPFMFLLLYSGLSALPSEPKEAAMTLGATPWQIFRYVTFPSLKPVILIAIIIRALEAFKIFDLVFIMTGGGPGTTTETLSIYIYQIGFRFGQLSYAAALAIVILITVSIVTRLAVRPLFEKEG